ncbi:hypothetical protein MYX07_06205 [Patescibacteria group bacterium AH-259-L07]|nr:hypothetical protein [Patescibacteria group bacterium AH-259-L07]
MKITEHKVASWTVSPIEMQVQVSHCNKGITKGPHQEYTEVELKWPTCKLVTSVGGLKGKDEVRCVVDTLVKKNLLGRANTLLLDMLCHGREEGVSHFEHSEKEGSAN